MVGADAEQIAMSPATATGQPEAGRWNWTTLLLVAATVPIALAGYQIGRRKRHVAQQPTEAVDSVFGSRDLDELWSRIPDTLGQRHEPYDLTDIELDELCDTLFHDETLALESSQRRHRAPLVLDNRT